MVRQLLLYQHMQNDIKSDSRYDKYYNWHFINELDEDYEDTVPSEKGDLFIAINRCLDILEGDSATDSERSFYLKLLIHFMVTFINQCILVDMRTEVETEFM